MPAFRSVRAVLPPSFRNPRAPIALYHREHRGLGFALSQDRRGVLV